MRRRGSSNGGADAAEPDDDEAPSEERTPAGLCSSLGQAEEGPAVGETQGRHAGELRHTERAGTEPAWVTATVAGKGSM